MTSLEQIAPAFVDMAHSIVWASVATVDAKGRPRIRIMHPIWQWNGTELVGWIATEPTPLKRAHLATHPDISISYWTTNHDTCSAECVAEWVFDDEGRTTVWSISRTTRHPSASTRRSFRSGRAARRRTRSPRCGCGLIGYG